MKYILSHYISESLFSFPFRKPRWTFIQQNLWICIANSEKSHFHGDFWEETTKKSLAEYDNIV